MSQNVSLPLNEAPYSQVLYVDPATGRRLRSRITDALARVPFELAEPIRTFPAYRNRRSHSGRYFFSQSGSHVSYESRFEKTALTWFDFCGDALAVSSNPFFFLWPKGSKPVRHVPDFFFKRRSRCPLLVDVKPEDRMTDADRLQHERSREACGQLGWEYDEFTIIDRRVELNLRFLSGYSHPRFGPTADPRAACTAALEEKSLSIAELVERTRKATGLAEAEVLSGIYHLIWTGDLRISLDEPLGWAARVFR